MNKVILMGRLTRDPQIRRTNGENPMMVAAYTLAVDRRFHREGEATADFFSCITFGRNAEFAEKYVRQGTKLVITGRLQTRNYTNKDNQKVYVTEVIVEDQEFAESKTTDASRQTTSRNESTMGAPGSTSQDDFMSIIDSMQDELPFR